MKRCWDAWVGFWFTAVDPVALHGVRVLTAVTTLAWLLSFFGHQQEFFGPSGWFDRQAYLDAAGLTDDPSMALAPWSPLFMIGSEWMLQLVYFGALLAVAAFALGLATRVTAVLTWLAVCTFNAHPVLATGGEALLTVLTFYLMLGYLLLGLGRSGQSPIALLLGEMPHWPPSRSESIMPSVAANVTLRLIQVHFAIAILATGLHKTQLGEWWSGQALFFALHPPMSVSMQDFVAMKEAGGQVWYLSVLSLAAYLTVAWQIGFVFFAWRPAFRPLLIGGAVVGWLGCAAIYGLPLFGPTLLAGCLSFVPAEQWRTRLDNLAHLLGLNRLSEDRAAMESLSATPVGSKHG